MAELIRILVKGDPVPQPRPRTFRHGKITRTVSAPAGHPVKTWKQRIILAAQSQYDGLPITGPITLCCDFVMARPKRLMRKKDSEGQIWNDKRPDLDNLIKAVKDSLNGHCWIDDSQVSMLTISKKYANKNQENIGVEIIIKPIIEDIHS